MSSGWLDLRFAPLVFAMHRKHVCSIIVLAALFVLPSCGPRTGNVSGTVTYKDKPLTHGHVIFIGSDGIPTAPAQIGADGRYEAKGVLYGECFVMVTQTPKDAKSASDIRREWKEKGMDPPPELLSNAITGMGSTLPEMAELKVTVSESNMTYDIKLIEK